MDTTAELLNDEGSDEVANEFLKEVEKDHSAPSWRLSLQLKRRESLRCGSAFPPFLFLNLASHASLISSAPAELRTTASFPVYT